MLLKTHVSTALALAVVLDSYLCSLVNGYSESYVTRFFLVSVSVLLQYMIDAVGHKWKSIGGRNVPVRNAIHSLPALMILSGAIGVAPAYMFGSYLLLTVPVSAALLHWVEDLVTEGGVYVFKKRFKLPLRARYDSPPINRATIAIFVVFLLAFAKPFDSMFNFILFSIALVVLAHAFLTV